MKIEIANQSGKTLYTKFTGNSLTLGSGSADLTIDQAKTGNYDLDSVSSGRIYFSLDKALSSDAPDGANPGDPDYYTKFDKVEITFDAANGGKSNLTAVDFFAIPFTIQTYIEDGSTEIAIQQFHLASGKTGNDLATAIEGAGTSTTAMQVTKDGATRRWLSPVKAPSAYTSLQAYVTAIQGSSSKVTIQGTYYGSPAKTYNYSSEVSGNYLKLTMANEKEIQIPFSSLASAIYTCDGEYYLDGDTSTPHHVSENDFYAAVYRDVVASMNLGYYDGSKGNDSTGWWGSASPYSGANSSGHYNDYAAEILKVYPGAYGFPFSDRQRTVLLNLAGSSSQVPTSKIKITVLDDSTAPTIDSLPGVLNPQTGDTTFNVVPVFADNIQGMEMHFGGKTFKAGYANFFSGTPAASNLNNGTAAQINGVPAQEGWNKYDFQIGTVPYMVLAKAENKVVTKAVISGGASSTITTPNLFTGSMATQGGKISDT